MSKNNDTFSDIYLTLAQAVSVFDSESKIKKAESPANIGQLVKIAKAYKLLEQTVNEQDRLLNSVSQHLSALLLEEGNKNDESRAIKEQLIMIANEVSSKFAEQNAKLEELSIQMNYLEEFEGTIVQLTNRVNNLSEDINDIRLGNHHQSSTSTLQIENNNFQALMQMTEIMTEMAQRIDALEKKK